MNGESKPAIRTRQFCQFSLKSIFILMLVVAAFLGGMAVKQRQMERVMAEAEQARAEAQAQAARALYMQELSAVRFLESALEPTETAHDQPADQQP
ncbi:MAG TPA: hypothetical protein VGX76_07865 [Pirellulales bacterium]|jgi:hypothetical protein|nr:hypothetical protein [Pirellulales bacterium]